MEMPHGISWVRNNVLGCSRCSAEYDAGTAGGAGISAFLGRHGPSACTLDIGSRPAGSMTIRQNFAVQLYAALITRASPVGDVRSRAGEAVHLADRLIAALNEAPLIDPRQALSDEEFERVVKAAPTRS